MFPSREPSTLPLHTYRPAAVFAMPEPPEKVQALLRLRRGLKCHVPAMRATTPQELWRAVREGWVRLSLDQRTALLRGEEVPAEIWPLFQPDAGEAEAALAAPAAAASGSAEAALAAPAAADSGSAEAALAAPAAAASGSAEEAPAAPAAAASGSAEAALAAPAAAASGSAEAAVASGSAGEGGATWRRAVAEYLKQHRSELRACLTKEHKTHTARENMLRHLARARLKALSPEEQMAYLRKGTKPPVRKDSSTGRFVGQAAPEAPEAPGQTPPGSAEVRRGSAEPGVSSPYTGLGRVQQWRRRAQLRQTLTLASGGDPKATADLLSSVLTQEEKTECQRILSEDAELRAWAAWGKTLVRKCQAQKKLSKLLCWTAKQAGLTKPFVTQRLAVPVAHRVWWSATDPERCLSSRRRGNGRQGFRRLPSDDVRTKLHQNSVERCKVVIDRAAARFAKGDKDGKDKPVKIQRALTDSKRQIFLKEHGLHDHISLSTFYRNARTDHRDVVRAGCRLDVCERCFFWDHSLAPRLVAAARDWQTRLTELLPGYCDTFHEKHGEVSAEATWLRGLGSLIYRQQERRPALDLPFRLRAQLHDLETEILHELRADFSRFHDSKLGAYELADVFAVHFRLRDTWKQYYARRWDAPRDDCITLHLDFAEHHTLPFGPVQTGKCYYAGYLLGVTILTVITWDTEKRVYYTFLSPCKEQSSLFAQACVMEVLARERAQRPRVDALEVFIDAGPHFLSCSFLAYLLIHVRETYKNIKRVFVHPAEKGHGKGPCDGEFGTLRFWRQCIAKKTWVNSIEKYQEELQRRADDAYEQDPHGPRRQFICFTPPAKETIRRTVFSSEHLRAQEMPIRLVPSWSAEGDDLRAHDEPGGEPTRRCKPRLVEVHDVDGDDDGEDTWRMYYRKEDPEAVKLPLSQMRKARALLKSQARTPRRASVQTLAQSMRRSVKRKAAAAKVLRGILKRRRR